MIDNRFLLIFVSNFIVNLNFFFDFFFAHLIFSIALTFDFNLTFFTNLTFFIQLFENDFLFYNNVTCDVFLKKKNSVIYFALISTSFLFLFSTNVIDDAIQINQIISCRITKN